MIEPDRCPRCNSPQPHLHPAVQFEGEVQECMDEFHQRVTNQNPWKPPPDEAVELALAALRNYGADTECGACMEVAFTGVTTNQHTCKAAGARPQPEALSVAGRLRANAECAQLIVNSKMPGTTKPLYDAMRTLIRICRECADTLTAALLVQLRTSERPPGPSAAPLDLERLVLNLQAHAKEHGWQDVDEPIADLLAWRAGHGDVTDWSEEWPTDPGWYWFYGKRSSHARESNLYPAEVRRGANSLFVVCAGAFLYREEGAEGLWLPMVLPNLPPDK